MINIRHSSFIKELCPPQKIFNSISFQLFCSFQLLSSLLKILIFLLDIPSWFLTAPDIQQPQLQYPLPIFIIQPPQHSLQVSTLISYLNWLPIILFLSLLLIQPYFIHPPNFLNCSPLYSPPPPYLLINLCTSSS